MRIRDLYLWKFRNFVEWKVKFSSSIVVLTGKNGTGKTNLLEAISLLIPGRGMRQAPMQDVGYNGAQDWAISSCIDLDNSILRYGTGLKKRNDGQFRRVYMCQDQFVNNKNKWDYAFPLVWITPQMDYFFVASTSGRRQFLDKLVATIYPWYGREISFYNRAMAQRNKLLQTRPNDTAWLDGLEKTMSKHSVAIAAARSEVVNWLNVYGQENVEFPAVSIEMDCAICNLLRIKSAIEVEESLCQQLRDVRVSDSYRGRSSYGVHRSDFALFYSKERIPAARASTGQQKTCLVGLMLALARLIEHMRHVPPILLLDEILVHLDENHRYHLLKYVKNAKSSVFLTGTDRTFFTPLEDDAQFINVGEEHKKKTLQGSDNN